MRVLSNIDNDGTVDGHDIDTLEQNIGINAGNITTNANGIGSLETNVASLSSTLSTKAATSALPEGTVNGSPLGDLISIEFDAGRNEISFIFAGGPVTVGVPYIV